MSERSALVRSINSSCGGSFPLPFAICRPVCSNGAKNWEVGIEGWLKKGYFGALARNPSRGLHEPPGILEIHLGSKILRRRIREWFLRTLSHCIFINHSIVYLVSQNRPISRSQGASRREHSTSQFFVRLLHSPRLRDPLRSAPR